MITNLKGKRLTKKLTQKELASRINVSVRQYQRFEKNERLPNVRIAIMLARILGTTVEELFPD